MVLYACGGAYTRIKCPRTKHQKNEYTQKLLL